MQIAVNDYMEPFDNVAAGDGNLGDGRHGNGDVVELQYADVTSTRRNAVRGLDRQIPENAVYAAIDHTVARGQTYVVIVDD